LFPKSKKQKPKNPRTNLQHNHRNSKAFKNSFQSTLQRIIT